SGVFRAGLAAFTKLFADRYAADNVRMNNVLPGFFDSLPEKADARARIPLGRYGKVEEMAATIAFLASEGGAYITGQNIRVDGGITRSVSPRDKEHGPSRGPRPVPFPTRGPRPGPGHRA